MTGYYAFKVCYYKGYTKKRKPQFDGWFLSVLLHILGKEKVNLVENQVLVYCYEEGLCILGWSLQATAVKGYRAVLLIVACQKRKP